MELFSKYLFDEKVSSQELAKEVGDFIKGFRVKNEITQMDFSDYLGISLRQVQRVESGNSNLSLEYLTILMKGTHQYSKDNFLN